LEIFVARQPIFDLQQKLFGYELLFRSSSTVNAAVGASSEEMASKVIIHSFVDIGLERITAGRVGFLNCTRETLLDGVIELLSPESLVVELLESIEPEPAVVSACERLRAKGYTLALDDFVYDPRFDPLIRLSQIVKLDVLNCSPDEVARLVEPLRPFGVRLLAERVEDAATFEVCRDLGCELFQGYHFSRPEILSRREISTMQTSILRLINLVRDDDATDAQIEATFQSDPTLTYKLLRIVNSAAVGGRGVESIRHAVRILGRSTLGRWLALLLVATLGSGSGPDRETSLAAMARARFCELLAELTGRKAHGGALFMVGVFSLLDVLLGTPLEELLGGIDVAPDVKDALLHRTGPYAGALSLVEAYDQGNWDAAADAARDLSVPATDLPSIYLESLNWAEERLREAEV